MDRFLVLSFAIILSLNLFAGKKEVSFTKKSVKATRVNHQIKLDGYLNEDVWKNAQVADHFCTYSPTIGETPLQDTKVKILYDDDALYIGALLYDKSPELILRELSKRDAGGANADFFWITLNPFNDGQNIFRFEVSAANVQSDIKISPSKWDRNWNAVWDSEVAITDEGWAIEIKIPYAAIRFTKDDIQNWSVNFWRMIRREREVSSWNPVDRTLGSDNLQTGVIIDLKDIEAPPRLELYPYVSGVTGMSHDDKSASYSVNYGMDLKYGLTESFTLDMTLVPDFGQTASDKHVLNLGPYETYYSENRAFFKEGTELFNKAGLFYSRRIGGRPQGYGNVDGYLNEGDSIIENPAEIQMINASKITGRTSGNLGIGFFNAMTANSNALILNEDGSERKYRTNPFTNYNMLVLDQIIGKASYVNLSNTNYYEPETGKVADVIGTAYKISSNDLKYAITGKAANSVKHYSDSAHNDYGQRIEMRAAKVSGNLRYNYNFKIVTNTYDQNDMGFMNQTNRFEQAMGLNYGKYEPSHYFQNWSTWLSAHYTQLYEPRVYRSLFFGSGFRGTLRNFISWGGSLWFNPVASHNYDETRVQGRFVEKTEQATLSFWFSSDYRKKFALDGNLNGYKGTGSKYKLRLAPRLRLNDKFSVVNSFEVSNHKGDNGYVTRSVSNDSIVFGDRNRMTMVNNLTSTYVFNNKSALSLNFRYYWQTVDYYDFYLLNNKGRLNPYAETILDTDKNYNTVNIDLTYSWNFAPGSFMSFMWKNSILNDDVIQEDAFPEMGSNILDTFTKGSNNIVSLKVTYYLDYQTIRKLI